LQFLAIPAEQKAMIESWANQGQESAVPVAPTPPQSSVPKASVPTARTSSPPRIERPRTERSATPAAPTFAGYSAPPKRRPSSTRYMRHKVVMLLVASVVAVVGMGWLRWEEGWRELESRLPGHTVEQPQATVPSEVMLHLLVHKVDPAVPDGIGAARARGRVVLDAVIGSDGTVLSLRPETGPDLLARVAMDAVQWWRFQPYQVNGQAVQVATKIAIDFP